MRFSSRVLFGILMCLVFLSALILVGDSSAHPDRFESLRPGGILYRITEEDLQVSLLPSEGPGQVRSYRFLCPALYLEDEYLAVLLNHQFASIEIDGSVVYRSLPSEQAHLGRSPGRYWALVPMKLDDAGKPVRIVVEDVYGGASSIPRILIADKGDLLLSAFRVKWKALTVSLLCIITGFLYMVSTLILRLNRRASLRLLYLGVFTGLFGLYRLTDFSVSALYVSYLNGNPRILRALSLLGGSLAPLFLDCFFSWVYEGRAVYRRMCAVMGLLPLLVLALLLSGLSDLRELLTLVTVLGYLNLLLLMLLSLPDLLQKRSRGRRDSMGCLYLLMGLACFFDIWSYYRSGGLPVTEITLCIVLLHALVRGVAGVRRAYREQERMQQSRAEIAEQQVTLLIDQVKSHFIYNTMNTIYSLCDLDVDKAKQVIHNFSRYLQINAESVEQTQPIPFLKELAHTRYYLSIETTRFPDRFSVAYDIGCDTFSLPALSLQPLAENAVHHGLLQKEGPGLLEIRTRETPEYWIVTVRDDGVGFDPLSPEEGGPVSHIGIENVRRRIELLCGGTLTLESAPGEGALATIAIPKEGRS